MLFSVFFSFFFLPFFRLSYACILTVVFENYLKVWDAKTSYELQNGTGFCLLANFTELFLLIKIRIHILFSSEIHNDSCAFVLTSLLISMESR